MLANKNPSFPTTRWTRVVDAGNTLHPRSRKALEELLQLYWYPIYAFLRRTGFSHPEAEDLTQDFFLYALEHGTLSRADPARGRFRTFMLTCLRNFVGDDRRKRNAAKRNGRVIELDQADAAERYAMEPVNDFSPDRVYERAFATEVLEGTLRELAAQAADDGKSVVFQAVRDHLTDESAETFRAIAAQLNMSASTLRSSAARFRRRWNEMIADRVGHTVANQDEIPSERQALEDLL
jgi:RNA polymerase sigma factor (sigma-70 family)